MATLALSRSAQEEGSSRQVGQDCEGLDLAAVRHFAPDIWLQPGWAHPVCWPYPPHDQAWSLHRWWWRGPWRWWRSAPWYQKYLQVWFDVLQDESWWIPFQYPTPDLCHWNHHTHHIFWVSRIPMSSKATFGGGGGSSGRGQQDGGGRLNSPCGLPWPWPSRQRNSLDHDRSRTRVQQDPGPRSSSWHQKPRNWGVSINGRQKRLHVPLESTGCECDMGWCSWATRPVALPCNKSSRNPVKICKVRSAWALGELLGSYNSVGWLPSSSNLRWKMWWEHDRSPSLTVAKDVGILWRGISYQPIIAIVYS